MRLFKLFGIGIIAGLALAFVMHLFYLFTGSKAYVLLYNVDYIPFLKQFQDSVAFGLLFHFTFCVVSVVGLFYMLKMFKVEYYASAYLLIYSSGAACLYFLSAFTDSPPAATDGAAWFYWTISHIAYGAIVGYFIKHWIHDETTI